MNYVIVIEPPKVKTKGALPVAETPLPKEAIPLCWAVTAATSSIGNVGALSSVINAKTQKVEI